MKIRLTENRLREIVKESIKKSLNEISSDAYLRAYNAANDKRKQAIGTPEWGKRNRQFDNFAQGYNNAYDREHGYDGKTESGSVYTLQFNDVLPNGEPLRVYINGNTVMLKSKYFDNAIDIAKLIHYKNYQRNFCILSPKTAQQVAKWFSQNHNPNATERVSEAFNPEFWSQYYENQEFNDNAFSNIQAY